MPTPAAAPAAAQTATAAAAPTAVEPSAAQQLFAGLRDLWNNLSHLTPQAFAVNLGLSFLILIGAAVAVWLLRKALHAGLARLSRRHGEPLPTDDAGKPNVAHWSLRLVQWVVGIIALVLVLSVWGLDLLSWLTRGSGTVVTRIAVILVLAAAAVEIAGFLIGRACRRIERTAKDGRRAQQLRTLAPILRGVAQAVIVIMAGLMLLSEAGVQIGPLIASAGVVGVAVGFGAQTLVKDFLTGFFLVVEDIVGVGDNVQIGESSGTVEAMTLRTIRLRNMDGTLHVFPYSEAQVIHNRTKDFSYYLFEIPVDYGADIDRALTIMGEVGAELRRETEWAAKITDNLEVLGVDKLTSSEVVLKARIRTRPREQWKVGREYNRRLKLAFDAAGIASPFTYTKIAGDGDPFVSANDAGVGAGAQAAE